MGCGGSKVNFTNAETPLINALHLLLRLLDHESGGIDNFKICIRSLHTLINSDVPPDFNTPESKQTYKSKQIVAVALHLMKLEDTSFPSKTMYGHTFDADPSSHVDFEQLLESEYGLPAAVASTFMERAYLLQVSNLPFWNASPEKKQYTSMRLNNLHMSLSKGLQLAKILVALLVKSSRPVSVSGGSNSRNSNGSRNYNGHNSNGHNSNGHNSNGSISCPLNTSIIHNGATYTVRTAELEKFINSLDAAAASNAATATLVSIKVHDRVLEVPTSAWSAFIQRFQSPQSGGRARTKPSTVRPVWQITKRKVTCKDGVSRTVYKNSAGESRVKRMVTKATGERVASYRSF